MEKIELQFRAVGALLESLPDDQIERLIQEYPSAYEYFSSTYTMGDASQHAEKHEVDVVGIRAFALTGLQVAEARAQELIAALMRRLRLARRLKLAGTIIASLFSAGVLPALGWGQVLVAATTASLSFMASLLALFGEHLEKPLVGANHSTSDLLVSLVNIEGTARTLRLRSMAELFSNARDIVEFAREVNGIATELRRLEIFGGISFKR